MEDEKKQTNPKACKNALVRSHINDLRDVSKEIKKECEKLGIVKVSKDGDKVEIDRDDSKRITSSNGGRALQRLRSDGTIKACYKLLNEFVEPLLMKSILLGLTNDGPEGVRERHMLIRSFLPAAPAEQSWQHADNSSEMVSEFGDFLKWKMQNGNNSVTLKETTREIVINDSVTPNLPDQNTSVTVLGTTSNMVGLPMSQIDTVSDGKDQKED